MNKLRRKALTELVKKLEEIQSDISAACESLAELRDEEEEYIENMPEGIRYSERGERAETAFDNLTGAADDLENLDLEAIIDQINEAIEA